MRTVSPQAPSLGHLLDDSLFETDTLQDALVCCSWNVRGLTDLKMIELILHMKRYNIDILCLQETHIVDTDSYEEQGFLVVLSGAGQE